MNLNDLRDLRMKQEHLEDVRALYRVCHPTWPEHTDWWWRYMNTLVITDRQRVVAYSCMTFSPPGGALPADALAAWLLDTGVAPSHRGQGLSSILLERRLDVAYAVGAQMAIGAAAPDNHVMCSLLASRGFTIVAEVQNKFPDGSKGYVYIKHLGGRDVDF